MGQHGSCDLGGDERPQPWTIWLRRTAITGAALSLALIPVAAPAQAAPAIHYDVLFPAFTHWFPKERTPPLTTLLRAYVLEHTNVTPESYYAVICLHKFKPMGKEAPQRGACARIGMGDLAPPGESVTWHLGDDPYPEWNCSTGRFYLSFWYHAVSDTGLPQQQIQYSPYAKGTKRDGWADWGTKPPSRSEAHKQSNCKDVNK